MKTELAKAFYNAAGVTEKNDPERPASAFAVDRIRGQLETVVKPGMRTLDLGCGAGRFTFTMESLGAVPTGVDCASVPLEHARHLAAKRYNRSTFHRCDVSCLPFEAGSFDLALLANNIVEFSPDDMDLMSAEVARILVAEGWFCISMRNEDASPELRISRYTVPGHGEFEYHSHAWTAAHARSVIGKHLTFVTEEELGEERYWLAFRNSRQG